ncbi:hypothetical protein KHM83_08625 [Fusibacter paucivorans]|uniref:General stress protein CsbD n=1 Tax=Fusibacter paucivorans TaxID=76009 RepID=A0ABS5PNI1_9FIRM|nr:hypothetical protein [Fusibacter paucivorans]MBS7526740.1 hypothetical protein [Fusibacter paucivorans]
MLLNDVKSKWEQIRHEMQAKWQRLDNANLDQVFNQEDVLIDMLEKEYGLSRALAKEEVRIFENSWRNRMF